MVKAGDEASAHLADEQRIRRPLTERKRLLDRTHEPERACAASEGVGRDAEGANHVDDDDDTARLVRLDTMDSLDLHLGLQSVSGDARLSVKRSQAMSQAAPGDGWRRRARIRFETRSLAYPGSRRLPRGA